MESIEEVLGTGLFSSRGPYRTGWAHQTYAEFLAARWVSEEELELDQILSLLTNPHDPERRLVPQLQETAAWIASIRDDAFRALVEIDPSALLRGDIATADNEQRRELARALLQAYDEERLLDSDWEIYALYGKLSHTFLPEQLRPYIVDPEKGLVVRRAALRIAEACAATPLQDDLIRLALAREESTELRVSAAAAAKVAANPTNILKLRPLLETTQAEDPADELRGHGLEALWPEHLSAEEWFANLDAPRRSDWVGQYSYFLHRLPEMLRDEDLTAGLEWIRRTLLGRTACPAGSRRSRMPSCSACGARALQPARSSPAEEAVAKGRRHEPLVEHSREGDLRKADLANPNLAGTSSLPCSSPWLMTRMGGRYFARGVSCWGRVTSLG